MIATVLRSTALVVALLAAWLVVGNAAFAGSVQPQRCHAAPASFNAELHAVQDASADAGQVAGHHHPAGDPDEHCPTGGMCCDTLCHAAMLTLEQGLASADAHYAVYATDPDGGLASRPVHGLDRPPRTTTL